MSTHRIFIFWSWGFASDWWCYWRQAGKIWCRSDSSITEVLRMDIARFSILQTCLLYIPVSAPSQNCVTVEQCISLSWNQVVNASYTCYTAVQTLRTVPVCGRHLWGGVVFRSPGKPVIKPANGAQVGASVPMGLHIIVLVRQVSGQGIMSPGSHSRSIITSLCDPGRTPATSVCFTVLI